MNEVCKGFFGYSLARRRASCEFVLAASVSLLFPSLFRSQLSFTALD